MGRDRADGRVAGDVAAASKSVIINARSDNLIRTQISLDENEYALAKKEAKSLGMSVAGFVRRAIRDRIPPDHSQPWMRYIGMVESGDSRSSQSIDDVIYGTKD
jgi:hypothetical protein